MYRINGLLDQRKIEKPYRPSKICIEAMIRPNLEEEKYVREATMPCSFHHALIDGQAQA